MPADAFALEWLNLVLRWAHVVAGIAWIGSSFYFIWLDARLNVPPRDPQDAEVAGDLWAVHGGGFYHSQKYRVAPAQLPEPLHWFKWEAYFTWMTGFALFTLVYYLNAETLLADPGNTRLGPSGAVAVSLALIGGGWLAYDGLNRLRLTGAVFATAGGLLLLAACWGATQLFSGRGAFMQLGVMLGTIMAANVFFVIIPAQKQLVAAKLAGRPPDAQTGVRAKRRSVHNNYLTLPVVFAMISPHYPFAYAHPSSWLVLFVIFAGGALVRHYFNLRNRGRNVLILPAAAGVILIGLFVWTAPRSTLDDTQRSARSASHPQLASPSARAARTAAGEATFDHVRKIVETRCTACHAAQTTHPTAPVAAAGVMFDTPRQIGLWAPRIYDRVVVTKTMPLANVTGITESERDAIRRWYQAGARVD